MFPVGLVIAVAAMSSGISSANFWIPVYLLWLRLDPRTAFWVSLLTMLFGFGSGVYRNLVDGTIHWPLTRRYLAVSLPAAVAGALLSGRLNADVLIALFSVYALIYGGFRVIRGVFPGKEPVRLHDRVFWGWGLVGGFLVGTVATGLGAVLFPLLAHHKKIVHHAQAVGSAIVVIFVCSFASLMFRLDHRLVTALGEDLPLISRILLFVIPGVLLGGQLGPRIAQKLPSRHMGIYVGFLLVFAGVLTFSRLLPLLAGG